MVVMSLEEQKAIQEKNERLEGTLNVFCQFAGIPLEVKDFHDSWLLLTYDLPNTPEGIKARSTFLNKARWLGAVQFNESVYMVPWTPAANGIIASLAGVDHSDIAVFKTNVEDKTQVVTMTNKYDATMTKAIDSLIPRVAKIFDHAKNERPGRVKQMAKKTWEQINSLIIMAANRGDEQIADKLGEVIRSLKEAEQIADVDLESERKFKV